MNSLVTKLRRPYGIQASTWKCFHYYELFIVRSCVEQPLVCNKCSLTKKNHQKNISHLNKIKEKINRFFSELAHNFTCHPYQKSFLMLFIRLFCTPALLQTLIYALIIPELPKSSFLYITVYSKPRSGLKRVPINSFS